MTFDRLLQGGRAPSDAAQEERQKKRKAVQDIYFALKKASKCE